MGRTGKYSVLVIKKFLNAESCLANLMGKRVQLHEYEHEVT